jgi:lipopolysaccharide/colanic/teichoic acid biosynthesis glycosyltransferase
MIGQSSVVADSGQLLGGNNLASSILFSNAGGRVVTIPTESGAGFNSLKTQTIDPELLEFEQEVEISSDEAAKNQLNFSAGSFAAYNATSEAFDLSHRWPNLSLLPTHTRKYELGKRIFDVALAIAIFPIVTLMILVIGALIALTSHGPIFFRQRRIGQHGRDFWIWKFRTMHPRADWILAEHLKRNPAAREEWNQTHKLRVDPRITQLGRVLRKTSLDELPQILNVLAGEMSFVGPRPIVHAEAVKYAERFPYYLAAVPGITGLWQVSGRCDVSYEARTLLDETYVCKWSMIRDIWILLKTPREVFNRNGAY